MINFNGAFIKLVLEEIGIVRKLNNLIMSCITFVHYKVILNGELTESFHPSYGIRQGDPLSPYIFVFCMEKLSHIINQKLSKGNWKTMKVSMGRQTISHLLFAYDLILFGSATNHQAEVMKNFLDKFCDLSGEQISFSKSRVFCFNNISDNKAEVLATKCGYPVTNNLGKYLGVTLIHNRITKATYKGILEKSKKGLLLGKVLLFLLLVEVSLSKLLPQLFLFTLCNPSNFPLSCVLALTNLVETFSEVALLIKGRSIW
ncbi:hypothetical protein Ddye_003838 [Dipteronia dyeriana]|uniref:Reverse transcriptase domain-containing protein n=1 Tax=Dipteronia dyeriana TaxID=168575 RepID=A0AAD9XT17_9ROSI|nr:hypothetical protein Ddye_003838 [Dipteronia dyeriana]